MDGPAHYHYCERCTGRSRCTALQCARPSLLPYGCGCSGLSRLRVYLDSAHFRAILRCDPVDQLPDLPDQWKLR